MQVGSLEIQLLANMARLQSDMEKAQRTVSGAVGKINNILGAIGAGISVDFLLGLAKKSNEYTKSLAALSTQISGATDQIKELDAASRKLSVQFGTDALKQSTAFYEILSAGITDTTQATALLTEANRLAIGGNADLMISVDGLTSIIKGYGDAAGTASEIADTMFTASLAGKLSIQELSENIGKVIPLATTMGVSLEEVTAGISALTLGGISAKESITGMRAILATVAKPSAEAARLAKDIGLEFNTAGIQAMGFAGFLEEVKTKTQGSADKMAILFGGVESLIPALALTGNAGVEFNNIMGQMANKAGAAENAFNKMAASPGFQWDKFMSTMSNIAITLGDALANVLTPAAEMASKALNKLFGFNNVTGLEKQVQLVNQLTQKVESMANRKHVPILGDFFGGSFIFDKKEFDLLEHQLEMAKADLAAMQTVQESTTGATTKDTAAQQANVEALEERRKLMADAAETARKYADPLKVLNALQTEFKKQLDSGFLSLEDYNRAIKQTNEQYAKPGIKERKSDVDKLNKAQQESLRIESEYVKLLEIEKKQQQDLIAPYKEGAKQSADRLNSMQDEIAALKLVRDRQISMKQAVELTTIARLEEKKAKATDSLVLKEIDAEIAARRKVIDLIPEYDRLQNSSGNAANQVSQQWIQAGRNIQSALSNSIFDFFNDGLDGMVRSLKSALLRMIAEAAALRLSESIGSVLLGGAGGSGGTGGQTAGLLASLFGAFNGAGVGIRTGGGVTTGTFSNAGGAGTAFIGGKGTAIGGSGMGVNATRGAGMGSSLMGMAALAGPYGMIAAATIMAGMELNKKYGDYKVSGFNKFGMNGLNKTDPIAVIANQFGIKGPGEIIGKALFGRGPYKFRQQSIQGDISAGGLDGTITDVFKSKGGLLVKNKHKPFERDIPSEIVRDIDKSIKSIYKSTGEFADNLGIDARSIDTFTKQIQIKSEKNKTLDTEKVKEELDAFNEDLIKSFMPDIDNFKLTGESAGETFKRLNNELDALKTGVQNLGGSAEFAKELIMGMSIDARSAVVDIAGGIDKLLEKTQFFSENFLTPTEQLAPKIAMVNEEMAKLGFSSVTTKDQFRELVQSMEIPAETRNALLDIAPAFLQILDAAKQIKAEANDNLLTLAQEFAPQLVIGLQRDMANEVLGKFGVTVDTSREKVTELLTAFVKSGGLFSNMADDVMEAAAAWTGFQQLLPAKTPAATDTPTKEVIDPMKQLASAYSALQRSVDAERKKITDKYNDELGKVNASIDNLTSSVGKLKSLSDSLKNAVDQIQPLTRGQAKFELLSAINNAKRGIFPEANDLQKVLNVLSDSNSITDAKSSFEFAREQAKTSLLIQDLGNLTDTQLSIEDQSLAALKSQQSALKIGFDNQMLRLDSMLTKAQEQIDALNGIDTKILSLSQALANFAKAYRAASAAQIPEVVVPPTGNPKITNKEIVDFARAPGRTEMEIYNKAKEVGVSFEQYAKATGANVQDLYDWAKKKGLPTFASGGYHKGGLRIVGEKGPELERTGPSHITSNKDMKKAIGNDEVVSKLDQLIKLFEPVIQGGTSIRTKSA